MTGASNKAREFAIRGTRVGEKTFAYGNAHPFFTDARSEIEVVEKSIYDELKLHIEKLKRMYISAVEGRRAFRSAMRSQLKSIADHDARVHELETTIELLKTDSEAYKYHADSYRAQNKLLEDHIIMQNDNVHELEARIEKLRAALKMEHCPYCTSLYMTHYEFCRFAKALEADDRESES